MHFRNELTTQTYHFFRLSKQAENFISKSPNYENIASGAPRSTELIQSYRNLYSEGRVQAFDAIDEIFNNGDIRDSERVNDVKTKLLFSVIVVRRHIGYIRVQGQYFGKKYLGRLIHAILAKYIKRIKMSMSFTLSYTMETAQLCDASPIVIQYFVYIYRRLL